MPAASIHIRTATAADNVLLAELGARTFADTFAKDNTPEDMQTYLAASFCPAIQATKLADPHITFLIAESDGVPAGYAQLHLAAPPPAIHGKSPIELVRIYADAPFIGQGGGAALMQASLQHAAANGCDTIWLSVWERNPRATAFYQKWGFAQVGTQGFYVGSDLQTDWLMLRNVLVISR